MRRTGVAFALVAWWGCGGGTTGDDPYPSLTDADADTDADTDTDADSDVDTDADADWEADPVEVTFTGTVITLSGAPFGFDDSVRTTAVSGSFAYDLAAMDSRDTDEMRGEYDHLHGGGPFLLQVGGRTVTGSGRPVASVELYGDTFRWVDGPQLSDPTGVDRTCSVDGSPDPAIQLSLSFTPLGFDPFTTDALPDPFPYAGREAGTDYLVTFAVEDAGGTLLLELESLGSAR